MLGWSMNLFRIRGIQLSVHASFALLLAYVGWEGWTAAGWHGAVWTLAYVLALFACVTLHELGHAVAARRFGVRVPRILLLPIGGMAEMDTIPRRPREEIIIALAGPATPDDPTTSALQAAVPGSLLAGLASALLVPFTSRIRRKLL